jgi:hypothetical protein
MQIHPTKKAILTTIMFMCAGVFALWIKTFTWKDVIPFLVFYILLVINTFFSIRCFASITPADARAQKIIDFVLVLCYFALAVTINVPILFTFFAFVLFFVAVIKYVSLLFYTSHKKLVWRKIVVDVLGALVCLGAFWGVFADHERVASWLWVGMFLVGNAYIFFVEPLYVVPK